MLKRAARLLPLARSPASSSAPAAAAACSGEGREEGAAQHQQVRHINFFTAPNGPSVKQVKVEDEWYCRQRNVFPLLDKVPYLPVDTFIAPNAVVCGDVDIYGGVSGRRAARWAVAAQRLECS